MPRSSFFLVLLATAYFTLSCGSGSSGRQLKSITIAQTANGNQIEFIATGNYSAPPMTVTPLPASWGVGPFAPPPPGSLQYQLTTQPFQFICTGSGPYLPITVFAPTNPTAPLNGSLPFSKLTTGSAQPTCP
jgi:hypothetical protein